MRDEVYSMQTSRDETGAIARHLASENEVLRCAAARAMGAASGPPETRREALAEALLDPDPDVRSDAMDAFAGLARPEDAGLVRRSLTGDPVREVKLAAIMALARIGDLVAVPLLRSLVLSRSEDVVAWEDENSDWEDWLDIQIAAISALGAMGVEEALGDMMTARSEETAQSLDSPVFAALTAFGKAGAEKLLEVVEAEKGVSRRRAVAALADMDAGYLLPLKDRLLETDDAGVRIVATRLLPEDSEEIVRVARIDPDPQVRLAAFRRAVAAQPEIIPVALRDGSTDVEAAALEHVEIPIDSKLHDTLSDNLLAWLEAAPPVLMTAVATRLPDLAPERAVEPLATLARDSGRPLEARIAAVSALARLIPPVPTEEFSDLLGSPAQQVRTAALVVLRDRAADGDKIAIETVARAVRGDLLPRPLAVQKAVDTAPETEFAAPKSEGGGARRIEITPDGDIVDVADAGANYRSQGSTLSSILDSQDAALPPEPSTAGETPEESGGKRHRRRPVEGPAEVTESLSLETMQTCAEVGCDPVDAALLARAQNGTPQMRRCAWQAMVRRTGSSVAGEETRAAAALAVQDDDPVIRLAAFGLLAGHEGFDGLAEKAARDADPLIRAWAVGGMPVEHAAQRLSDPAQAVRSAAVERLLRDRIPELLESAVAELVAAERPDTLGEVLRQSSVARRRAVDMLAENGVSARACLILLDALARTTGRAGQLT